MAGILVASIFWPLLLHSANADDPPAPVLRGRVVDEEGRPLEDVYVYVLLESEGMVVCDQATGTGADGRYEIRVPEAEGSYYVSFSKEDFERQSETRRPSAGDDRVTVLTDSPLVRVEGRVVDVVSNQPVAGANVAMIRFHTGLRSETRTDEQGRFAFEDCPRQLEDGIAYAEKNGRFTQIKEGLLLPKGADTLDPLIMAAPGWIEGTVTTKATGDPLPGCAVEAHSRWTRELRFVTTTDESGAYRLDGIPRGHYRVIVCHPEWAMQFDETKDLQTMGLRAARIIVTAGKAARNDVEMLKKAIVRGRVLGPDNKSVPNAKVSVYPPPWVEFEVLVETRTDEKGRFEFRTGIVDPEPRPNSRFTIAIHASAEGMGEGFASVSGLEEGEIREGIRHGPAIRLCGMMRVFGRITTPDGEPAPNMWAWPWLYTASFLPEKTDGFGRFDFGWVCLPVREGETFKLRFIGDRPDRIPPTVALGARFFHHKEKSVTAEHGKELEMNVVVQPTELLTFTGQVVDADGTPLPRASLMLFLGNAQDANWRYSFYHEGEVDSLRAVGWSPVYGTVTDEDGRYTLSWVREDADTWSMAPSSTESAVYGGGILDPTLFSIGAIWPGRWPGDGPGRLVPDIRMPIGRTEIQVDIQLPAREKEVEDDVE